MNNEKLFKAQVSIAAAYIRAHGQYVPPAERVADYANELVALLLENNNNEVEHYDYGED